MSFISYLVFGLSQGSIYALIALGYTMVYGIAKMLNFAHGDIIMVGGYAAFITMASNWCPLWLSMLITVAVCTVLGVVIEKVAYRPLRSSPPLAVLITAIGVSYLLQNVAQLTQSATPKIFTSIVKGAPPFLQVFDGKGVIFFDSGDELKAQGLTPSLVIDMETFLAIAVSLAVMIALVLFINKTKAGKAMLACSEDRGAAQLMGINVNGTITLTFAIGSALAAVAALLMCSKYPSISPTTGSMPGIKAFVAAVFGGIGSIPGAMIGGVLLGVIERLSIAYISSEISDAIVFMVLIVVLVVRPTGIMGKKINEKV
ncbi:MAG: branched-chain amino acid ABC transporter permease [Lachnospiraceae bacterium]|nr:branched-chain amino acid ABC transporter permease [Ruminococcus sp.]MCM1275972.1 branched-chain amino acid ABC transporter permease [Lachnospiraceae bacterium]